jgi:hypothetical protein
VTKANERQINELFEDLDASLDYSEYATLERRDPRLAERLRRLVKAGVSARRIAVHVVDTRPHRWVESQTILAAARWLEGEMKNE